MPVVPELCEAYAGLNVQAQPGQIIDSVRPCFKIKNKKGPGT